MPDPFIVGLVGGLILLAVLMGAFGPTGLLTGSGAAYGYTPELVKDIKNATPVGVEEKEFSKVYNFAVQVSNVKQTRTESADYKKIFSGLMFGEDSLRFFMRADGVEDARVSFHVKNTNSYGPLVIKLNGESVFSETLNIGDYSIFLPKRDNLTDYNVEILAGSSGARMWAPAFYELENVKLDVTSYVLSSSQVKFTFDDFQKFTRGELELHFDEHFGTAIIELNGEEIFRGPADEFQLVKFSNRIGYQNLLTIKSEHDSKFTGSGTLKVFYTVPVVTKIELPFSVAESKYNSKLRGYIKFNIVDVSRAGGYTVKIYHDGSALYNQYMRAEEGYQSFTFTSRDVRIGENILVIESVDGAAFSVKDLQVRF